MLQKSFIRHGFAIAFLFGLFVAFNSAVANAQVSCINVLRRTVEQIDNAEEKGWQVLHMNMSTIDRGSTSSYATELKAGVRYAVIAVGDGDRVQDLDLYVLDEDGDQVGKDDDSSNLAIVYVRPRYTGKFRCVVKGYSMSRADAFFSIIIVAGDD